MNKVEYLEEKLESCLTVNIVLKNTEAIYNVLSTNGRMFDDSLYEEYSDIRGNSTDLHDYFEYLNNRIKLGEITLDMRQGQKILEEILYYCYEEVVSYIGEIRGGGNYMSMYDLDTLTKNEFDDFCERSISRIMNGVKQKRKESFKENYMRRK